MYAVARATTIYAHGKIVDFVVYSPTVHPLPPFRALVFIRVNYVEGCVRLRTVAVASHAKRCNREC